MIRQENARKDDGTGTLGRLFQNAEFIILGMKNKIGGEQYDCECYCDPSNGMDPGRNGAVHGDDDTVKLRAWDDLTTGMWTDARLF